MNLQLDEGIFNIISIVFLIIFIGYSYNKGIKFGATMSIFLWAFFVCSVPIPQVALLLAFPAKHFFNISMFVSQIIISIFAGLLLVYFYVYRQKTLLTNSIGKVFIQLIKKRLFLIFILSIVASVIGTRILDDFVDVFLFKGELIQEKQRKFKQMLFLFILFLLLNIWYLNYYLQNNVEFK